MQFTTNKKALRDAGARVNAIVPSGSYNMALSGILIEAVNSASAEFVNVWAGSDLDLFPIPCGSRRRSPAPDRSWSTRQSSRRRWPAARPEI